MADEEIAEAVRFRKAFGFRSDLQYVVQAASDFPRSEPVVPLSEAESAEMARRVDVSLHLGPAVEWAETQSGYAGVFIDHTDGGVPVFLATEATEGTRRGLEARLPAGTRYRVETVERS